MPKVDLHIHTKFSDGTLTLEEILWLASKRNVEEVAITDHDTIINLRNCKELENLYGVRVIPGVEIATDIKGMHILGYGIKNFEMVEEYLIKMKILNEDGAKKTIEILKNQGINISLQDVVKVMTSDILTKRDIVRYMILSGYATTTLDVYKNFIGRGNNAYVPVYKNKTIDVLNLIINSGGIPVLAHPYTLDLNTNFDELIPQLISFGLKGIETNTVRHNEQQKVYFSKIAQKHLLIETAGTDFHHIEDGILIGVDVEQTFLDKFHSSIGE